MSEIERGTVTNPTIETLFRILETLRLDLTLEGTRKSPESAALVYRSPFTLDELSKKEPEYTGESVVPLLQETLKDPNIPVEYRRLLATQVQGLAKAVKVAADELEPPPF